MNKIFNWVFGSFFRTLGRILVYIILGLILSYLLKDIKLPNLFTILDVSAETFTQESRFTYYLYRNSDTPLTSGTGLLDSYGGSGYNRVQFLYNLYTFDSNYLYDIIFTTYFSGNGGTGVLTADIWGQSCSIYTGSGSQYNCSYTGGYDGNQVYMRSSINNMVGTDLSTLWLNFYSSGVSAVNFLQNSYKLEINRKENKNVTSENLQNATDTIINNQNNNTNSIINNQNSNSQNEINNNNQQQGWNRENATNNANNIINNQNQNKQDIIDNQNANSQAQIDSQKVCSNQIIDKNSIIEEGFLKSDGTKQNLNTWGITDYIKSNKIYKINNYGNNPAICFYDLNKTLISCIINNNVQIGYITVPSNTEYFRASINIENDAPQYRIEICKNGNQATNDTLNDMNSSINNSDSSQATNDASNFFSNFTTNTHGLTGIITAPLNAINSLTSSQCSPLVLPLPFINEDLTLPCMRTIYEEYFGGFMQLYDIITLGIISYWVMVRIFALVKDFKNPEHDEIEVLDL